MAQIGKVGRRKELGMPLGFWPGRLGAQCCQSLDGGHYRGARIL